MRSLPSVLAAVSVVGSVHGVIIDDFRSGDLWLETATYSPGATEVQSGLSPASVAGGARSVYVGSNFGTTSVRIDPLSGSLALSPTVTETYRGSGYLQLDYGIGSPLDLDLLAAGDTAFAFDFDDAPLGVFHITVESSSPSSGYRKATYQLLFADKQNSFVVIPFSNFPKVDFSSVDRLTFSGGRIPEELRLNGIHTVPEPSVGMLSLLAATVGLACSRSKRRPVC